MSYLANVFSILVAGPSDVANERRQVAAAIEDWNQAHSRSQYIVLRAVGWEGARPELGDGPQAVINHRVVDPCDAIIAVFNTRIGTRTPTNKSGTVEEINHFQKNGKPVMVYFSDQNIKRKGLSLKQLSSLEKFKSEMQSKGLLGRFSSLPNLHQQVIRHLIQLVHDFANLVDVPVIQGDQSRSLVLDGVPAPPEVHSATQDRSRKACLSLASIGPIQGLPDASEMTFNFRNEGDYPAYDVKVTFDDGAGFTNESHRIDIPEIPPRNAPQTNSRVRRKYTKTHRVQKPRADSSGEPIKDQELHIRVRATFRDGHGERDEAIFVVHCLNQGWGWKPVEEPLQAVLSPICKFVRPQAQANPHPSPVTGAVAPAAPRPKQLSANEHEMMNELVRRSAAYPTVFRASILRLPAGDDKQGYQSVHITGTPVPSDARDMMQNDRDVIPTLVRQGFLHRDSNHEFSIDDSLFSAYGFDPPS